MDGVPGDVMTIMNHAGELQIKLFSTYPVPLMYIILLDNEHILADHV
jgi:hypothetical protein